MTTPNVLMVGSGEYTTGYVHGNAAKSDKGAGVVALTLFDLRRQGRVGRLLMAGTNGTKMPGIRSHLQNVIGNVYADIDTQFEGYLADTIASDPLAYRSALGELNRGDIVIIFTPDDTHFPIAMDAVQHGCHVLIAKPLVKKLSHHLELSAAAKAQNSLVAMEVHKRWDPFYIDARDRIRSLGDFSFFQSYMSQPKSQLDTFRSWAGKSSDISYYLNAHHIDFHAWSVGHMARPVRVRALAATGWATSQGISTEDTITLTVDWEHMASNSIGTAIYTASWIAPRSDVHSQQRFFYMGQLGEINVDQAHRGYAISTDDDGFGSANPLFMKYTPDANGAFAGQQGYGYQSIADFVDSAIAVGDGESPDTFKGKLATIEETALVTAILEAGRVSLDADGATVSLAYDESGKIFSIEV